MVAVEQNRRRRKPAAVRRQDIINAAMEIIRHEGIEKLTTRSLSRAVGIAQPTLFLHFGNKNQVLIALVEAIQQRLEEQLGEQHLDRLPALERIEALVRFHLGFMEQQPGMPRLLFSEELQSGDPALRERMNRMITFFVGVLAEQIGAAQQAGQLRTELDPQRGARLLVAAIQGLAFRWVLSGHNFSLRAEADLVLSTFLGGWRSDGGR
ncbi:MAG: TetR/AcrR family transcriptional regulator [Gammaproteobacteria bacterium]